MIFKEFFWFIEAVDPAVRDAILSSKWPYAKEKIELAANDLEKEYEGKPSPSKKDAFKFIHQILGHERRRRLPPSPENAKLKQYHDKMIRRQITVPEYKLAQKYIDNPALDEVMAGLRKLIQDKVITFNFKTEPEILYNKKIIRDFNSLNQILSNIHHIQGKQDQQQINPQEKEEIEDKADPALLAISNAADLVYHVPADPATGKKDIWVFKGSDPLKCRLMGKGQSWCISSSTSVRHYFDYKHRNGQTQYFIFDYNKPANDPTRYVNPGIAPTEDEEFHSEVDEPYEEWVDSENSPNELHGYKTVDDYKEYLASMGVPLKIFNADPHTPFELKLFKLTENKNWKEAYKDPKMWNFYWQIAESLPDEAYEKLTKDEKFAFAKAKFKNLTTKQLQDVFDLYNTNKNKFWEWAENKNYIIPEEFMGVAKKFLKKLNNKDEEFAFFNEWKKNIKDKFSSSQVDYVLKNFGEKAIKFAEDAFEKTESIQNFPLYMSLTGKFPPNFMRKLEAYTEQDNWNGLSWFIRTLLKLHKDGDNIPNVLQAIPEKYFQLAAEASKSGRGKVDFLQGFAENENWFKDISSIQKAEKFFKDKLKYNASIFEYIPNIVNRDIKNILYSDSIPDDVKDYISSKMSKSSIKNISVSHTSHHGTEPEIKEKRSQELKKQTKVLLQLMDKNWSNFDINDLNEILNTHANKRDILRYYKLKGVKLEDLFSNPMQIYNLINDINSTASTWPDQVEAIEELGPEIIRMLPPNQLERFIVSSSYMAKDYINNIQLRNALATMVEITPENVNNILLGGLKHAPKEILEKIKNGPYYNIIKNVNSATKASWIITRLYHQFPLVFFDHNDLHNMDDKDLLNILDSHNFDMSLIDDFNKKRLIASLHSPLPRHMKLSTPLLKLIPLMTEQEIKDLIPDLVKIHGPFIVAEAMFWARSKLPKSLLDSLPENVKKYMDSKYH